MLHREKFLESEELNIRMFSNVVVNMLAFRPRGLEIASRPCHHSTI